MLNWDQVTAFKKSAPFTIDQFPSGAACVLVVGDTIQWKEASGQMDLPALQVGRKVSPWEVPPGLFAKEAGSR